MAPSSESSSFPRSARLLVGRDFQRVFDQNIRVSDRHFTILAHVHDSGEARLGLAIARKRARRAIDRNRIKRITREQFRHQREALRGVDLVVMNRDAAAAAEPAALHDSLVQLLNDVLRKKLKLSQRTCSSG